MRVLVVAGTGFLGGHVVRAFLDRGDRVTALVRDPKRADADARLEGADILVGGAGALPAIDRHDVVVYAAGASGDDGAPASEVARRCQEVYVDGVKGLGASAADWGAHFILLSGVSRFGERAGGTVVDEDTPPGTLCVFGTHKRKSEALLAAIPGLRWTALVPLEMYGARASKGYVPFVHDRIRAGRFVMLGDGTNRWSLCNVHNVVDAIIAVAPGDGRGPLLIADEHPTSQHELATAISRALGRSPRFPRLPGDVAFRLARIGARMPAPFPRLTPEQVRYRTGDLLLDTSKAARLGIEPRHGLREGIAEAVAWWSGSSRAFLVSPPDMQLHAARVVRRGVRAGLHRVRAARFARAGVPRLVNWDLTYACPMRCVHCYSESGRRQSRQLPPDRMMRIADVLTGLSPVPEVVFTGGEPLLVRDILAIAARLRRGGARLALYTSGSGLRPPLAAELAALFHRIAVSIDADTPEVNDAIRGRPGAYETAIAALDMLDGAARETRVSLGVECTVVRSGLNHLDGLVRDLPRRFPRIDFVHLGAAIPTGLASEEPFAARELLDQDELTALATRVSDLRAIAPFSVRVALMDNAAFLMSTEQIRLGKANDYLAKIEADGRLRAVDIYEGTVGSVLEEPFDVLWARACARHDDPEFQAHLSGVRTMGEWASATRAIDRRYASQDDLVRLRKR